MARSEADRAPEIRWPGRQLALDLAPDPGFGREDFLVSASNARAFAMIELWPDWPDPVLLITGPAGAGKSHLGSIWAAKAEARIVCAAALAVETRLDALAERPLLVENLETIGRAQPQLFHLVNLVRSRGTSLAITAREPLEACGVEIADLLSRLRLAPRVTVGSPDEPLMRAVLVKLLVERQLAVDETLVNYVTVRLERSLGTARAFVEELDRYALSQKAKVTRALASEVLRSMALGEDTG